MLLCSHRDVALALLAPAFWVDPPPPPHLPLLHARTEGERVTPVPVCSLFFIVLYRSPVPRTPSMIQHRYYFIFMSNIEYVKIGWQQCGILPLRYRAHGRARYRLPAHHIHVCHHWNFRTGLSFSLSALKKRSRVLSHRTYGSVHRSTVRQCPHRLLFELSTSSSAYRRYLVVEVDNTEARLLFSCLLYIVVIGRKKDKVLFASRITVSSVAKHKN
jgi:hypothetical protein